MKKGAYRLCSVFLAALILSVVVAPVCAVETDYFSKDTFWRWMAGSGGVVQKIIGYSFSSACSASDDGYHHASSYTREGKDGTYQCNCIYCGDVFIATESDIKQSYDNYVETLPAPGYTSTGGLLWQVTLNDLDMEQSGVYYYSRSTSSGTKVFLSSLPYSNRSPTSDQFVTVDVGVSPNTYFVSSFNNTYFGLKHGFIFRVPISGSYRRTSSLLCSYKALSGDGSVFSDTFSYSTTSLIHFSAGDICDQGSLPGSLRYSFSSLGATVFLPVYEIIPDTALSGDIYNINTRPTSITGGNYGIVGDNGQITKVEDNSTIINETNNTFYNPATGTTVPIVNWSYDYSDRSYKVTLESGDTATVTYGDENITISQITTTEGDTITNNYTIYYLVDGSGSENPPSTCVHDWQETNTTPATCIVPGSKLSTCSKCQQTKKDPLPALGHDWQVKQTVTTEYDDTGQLIQEGYTIFECSRCHEQYKSPDGTIPPGGGSSTDPGDEEETIWDKLGKLLGTAVKALLDLLGSAVDVILGGLIDLITNLVESLKQLVDLFGTVGEAFQVLWTWLPPEITAILVAGVSIFVFVALLKFFMK